MPSKVQYKIDLPTVFDRVYSSKGAEFRSIARPILQNADVKNSIGLRVIEKIINRTQNDFVDKKNKPFAEYSEKYKKSLIFKIYGKSDKEVNLTLTGEMLASMTPVAKSSGYQVIIEFVDSVNNDKAYYNIHRDKKKPARDFFGLPQDEEESILKEVVDSALSDEALTSIDALFNNASIDTQVGEQSDGGDDGNN